MYHYCHTHRHNYFAMTLLGLNLESLFERCGRRFSAKTLLMITDQLLHRIKVFHDRTGHVHRDIKPENLVTGRKGAVRREMCFF